MSEIVDFVHHGAVYITPAVLENVLHQLPLWKAEFTQIEAPKYPHLVDQLEFLADAVEDFAEGAYKDLPYVAAAEALFALTYAHKKIDIIPDTIPNLGRADDSSIARAVLIQYEKYFRRYADRQGIEWSRITSKP
jgi:uncharacterized membrane protein YkvA (DUF1232 family)